MTKCDTFEDARATTVRRVSNGKPVEKNLFPNRADRCRVSEASAAGQWASAAGEKLGVMMTMDYLRREGSAGRREDFEKYLAAVPNAAPSESDRVD